MSLNGGPDEEVLESPKCKKKVSYTPNRRGPSAGCVAAQCANSPENSSIAVAIAVPDTLKGVQSPPATPVSEAQPLSTIPALSGVPSMPVTSEPLKGIQSSSTLPLPEVVSLSAVPASTGAQSMPENSTPIVENSDKLPDLVTNQTNKTNDEIVAADKPTTNPEPRETFSVDPLSTEDEMDAVDALLSLQDLRDDTVELPTENEQLMPIGGANLLIDVAPVPLELDQVHVGHAIAKMTKQEEEEADADCVANKDNVDPGAADAPKGDSDADAKVSSPGVKGEFKTTTHALKKKVETKRTYKCGVCGTRKPSLQLLNDHHKRHHEPQMCGICGRVFNLASSLNRHMYSHDERRFNCDKCDFICHFESELASHKVSHRKTPTHKCMVANCGRWFKRKWELTSHVQTHDENSF